MRRGEDVGELGQKPLLVFAEFKDFQCIYFVDYPIDNIYEKKLPNIHPIVS